MQGPGLCNGCNESKDCFNSLMPAAAVCSLAQSAVSCSEMPFRNCSDEAEGEEGSIAGLDDRCLRSF